MTVEGLTDGDGMQASTITEQDEMFRRESFLPNEYNQYLPGPLAGHSHQSVTEQAVKGAIFLQSVQIAPGPDELCLVLYTFSRSGTKRELWSWQMHSSRRADTQHCGT